jgi:hypothetical protein
MAKVFRIRSAVAQAGTALVALALIAGCSGLHQGIALKADDSVAIVVSKDVGWPGGPFEPGRVRVLYDAAASREVRGGMGAGAVVGGAIGLLCGPLAPACVPMGAVQGAQLGGLAGWVVGSTGALPEEAADRLRDRVERVLESQDVRGLVESDVAERARARWSLDPERATAIVDIRLQEFWLGYTRDQRVRCVFRVNVAVREQPKPQSSPGRSPWPGDQMRVHEYVCPYADVAAWLDESQGLVEATLAAASRHLATEIVAGLAGSR